MVAIFYGITYIFLSCAFFYFDLRRYLKLGGFICFILVVKSLHTNIIAILVCFESIWVIYPTARVIKRVTNFTLKIKIPFGTWLLAIVSIFQWCTTFEWQLWNSSSVFFWYFAWNFACVSWFESVLITIASTVIKLYAFTVYLVKVPEYLIIRTRSSIHR